MRQTPDFALIISPAGTSPQMFRRRKQCYGFALSSLKSGGVCIKSKFVTDYRTFMKDFLKVVDFVHYLRAEGYDMVTFKKVCDDL